MMKRVIERIPVITEWTTFTPAGSWTTNVTYTGLYRRVGENLEMHVKVACSGAPTTASLTVTLPFNLSVATLKLIYNDAGNHPVGWGMCRDSGANSYQAQVNQTSSTPTLLNVMYGIGNAGAFVTVANVVNQAAPFTFGASDAVTLFASVPIAGWSAYRKGG